MFGLTVQETQCHACVWAGGGLSSETRTKQKSTPAANVQPQLSIAHMSVRAA